MTGSQTPLNPPPLHPGQVIKLSLEDFECHLGQLYIRDEQLLPRVDGERYSPKEEVDLYAISAYAEALLSEEIDGDLWGTLEDIDEAASTEQEAWDKIVRFYISRGAVLLDMGGGEQWLFAPEVLRLLGLSV